MFTKQKFSIRKLKAYGTASVLLGSAILSTTPVDAATVPSSGPVIGILQYGNPITISGWDTGIAPGSYLRHKDGSYMWDDDGDPMYVHFEYLELDPIDGSIRYFGKDTDIIPPLQRATTNFIYRSENGDTQTSREDIGVAGKPLDDISSTISTSLFDGWTLVSSDRPDNTVLDNDSTTDQLYTLIFEKSQQYATVQFIDEADPTNPLAVEELTGKTGDAFGYDHSTKLNELLAQNYEFVSNDYPGADAIYSNFSTDKELFTIVLRKKPVYSVTVKFTLTDGSELLPDEIDTNGQPTGTSYSTLEYRKDIINKDNRQYRFVRVEGIENSTLFDQDVTVTYVYEEVFKTSWIDTANNVLRPEEIDVVTKLAGAFDNYQFISSSTDAIGNVTHLFGKLVSTHWVDTDGNILQPQQTDISTKPAGDIANYTLVNSTTDANGNVTHVFGKLVSTHWVDTDGNILQPQNTDTSTKPAGDIANYTLVNSTTDANGNVTHVFGKLISTHWVDTDGNILQPQNTDTSTKPAGDITNYTLVSSTTDANGNMTHVFSKIVATTSSTTNESTTSGTSRSTTATSTTNKQNASTVKSLPKTGENTLYATIISGIGLLFSSISLRSKRDNK